MEPGQNAPLKSTPLTALHEALGARMVPFTGYSMPVQFATGILKEHLHTRAAAGLFDVSHMGQVLLHGPDAAIALEKLVPGELGALREGRLRYTQFTDDQGGILDDLMVTNAGDHLYLVLDDHRSDHCHADRHSSSPDFHVRNDNQGNTWGKGRYHSAPAASTLTRRSLR